MNVRIANREAARPVLVDGARMQGCKLTEIIGSSAVRRLGRVRGKINQDKPSQTYAIKPLFREHPLRRF